MFIDWFTVFAQVVNFLVLVWLLKRFLYGPIIAAMDRREERIAGRLREGSEMKEQAEKEAEEFRNRAAALEERKRDMLSRAETEAEVRRRELVEGARAEVEKEKAQWRTAVEDEKEAFLRELGSRACAEVLSVAERALRDLSDTDLNERMAEVFIGRLREAAGDHIPGAAGDQGDVVVTTSFDLSPETKEALEEAIREKVSKDAPVSYRTSKGLLCGIEVRYGGFSLGWSLGGFLKGLEEEVSKSLEEGLAGPREAKA